MNEIPAGTSVKRTSALDAARHLSIRGRYLRRFATPDPWATWQLSAFPAGRRIIREQRPDAIWSTFPIASAHVIADKLHRESGIPWVADFRDVMTEADYPSDPAMRIIHRNLEHNIVSNAQRVVMTTPGAEKMYSLRYRAEPHEKWHCIRNGYDEKSFASASPNLSNRQDGKIRLVHSGLLYPDERDPSGFFEALSRLKARGIIDSRNLTVSLRSTGHDRYHANLLKEFGIADLVSIEPGIPYVEAISEMLSADGLLIFQASNCNNQVPAKLYEYFRAGRPIFAMTDPAGDTARTMLDVGMTSIARIDSTADIEQSFETFLRQLRKNEAHTVDASTIEKYSRRVQTAQLGLLLDQMIKD